MNPIQFNKVVCARFHDSIATFKANTESVYVVSSVKDATKLRVTRHLLECRVAISRTCAAFYCVYSYIQHPRIIITITLLCRISYNLLLKRISQNTIFKRSNVGLKITILFSSIYCNKEKCYSN